MLDVNSEVLQIILDYFQFCNYSPEIIIAQDNRPILDLYQESAEFNFLKKVDGENLLLFALAVHKLGISCLQCLVCAFIAEIVYFEDVEAVSERFEVDLTDDEQMNVYLKGENKWATVAK